MQIWLKVLVFGFVLFIVFQVIGNFDRVEIAECRKWEAQSVEYPGFYLLQWQKDQCKAHDIHIPAPVQ